MFNRKRGKKRPPKRVLALPDLEHAKMAVVNSLTSASGHVAALRCEYKGQALPPVTASLGVATTPPEARSRDVHQVADQRQILAKKRGKNQVVAG